MKLFKSLYYVFKELVRSSIFLNYIYLLCFDRKRFIADEKIAVVGFPRVGNTFAGRVVKIGFGEQKIKLVNHYHSSAQAINAVKSRIPTVLIIRKPLDTILSLYIYNNKNYYVSAHFLRFIIYHLRIYSYSSKMLIIAFEEFSENPNIIIQKINNKFNLKLDDSIINIKQMILDNIIQDNLTNPLNNLKLSAPSEEKNILKKKYRETIKSNYLLKVANYLTNKILKRKYA